MQSLDQTALWIWSGQPLDTDHPGCIASCQGGETEPKISRHFFCGFLSPTHDFCNRL